MSSWLDSKYITLLSSNLRNFKRKGPNLYNFSCFRCGDSKKNLRKARGYVYSTNIGYMFHCHNCGYTCSAKNLIKQVNPILYEEYNKELLLEKYQPKKEDIFEEQVKQKIVFDENPFKELQKISDLNEKHICKQYVLKRKLPLEWHSKLYYCPKFLDFTNSLIPEKFDKEALCYEMPRLIIPFYSKGKNIFGYQGRVLDNDYNQGHGADRKYITIILDENEPKIFGLDHVDLSRDNWLLEGPFDSMFISNSTAVAGGELLQVARLLGPNVILVFDNEPRSEFTCKKMQKAINLGYKIVIWPQNFDYKDINQMIIEGYEKVYIQRLMKERTFFGLKAELEYNEWKRC